jgi:DNA end-binding protein Ku
MAPRASWKGRMRLGEIAFGVKLYTAATTLDRVALHMVNRRTGNRLKNALVDAGTGKPVGDADEVMGYELDGGDYVLLEAEELAAAVPESDKILPVDRFLRCDAIDTLYFDRPYYLAPADTASVEAFALIRDGMERAKVAALAQTVLFRRVRTLLIRPEGAGFIANTLNFDYEVRSAERAFADIPKIKIESEMLDLAEHIIDTKRGDFDPESFDDRYDAALAELVRAKLEGRPPQRRKDPPREKVVDLMAALRESAKAAKGKKPAPRPVRRKAS